MPIYTKTGDKGETGLFGGKRLPKYDLQVEAYGSIDEATSFIGLAREAIKDKKIRDFLTDIQHNLYKIMAYLSNAPLKEDELKTHTLLLEKEIDYLEASLPKLTRFILPQGSGATVRVHVARATVRRAERRVVEYVQKKKAKTLGDKASVQYLNRLSDYLFMLARRVNNQEKST